MDIFSPSQMTAIPGKIAASVQSTAEDVVSTVESIPGRVAAFFDPGTADPFFGKSASSARTSVGIAGAPDKVESYRVRLSAKPGAAEQVYGPKGTGLLDILHSTGGVQFPYTPSISLSGKANYDSLDLIHSIQSFKSFQRTEVGSIDISATFTVQSMIEGTYALACLHFFRTVTKMYFGAAGPGAQGIRIGVPPPVLLLNGYGPAIFNNLPVVITSYTLTLPKDANYVRVPSRYKQEKVRQVKKDLDKHIREFEVVYGSSLNPAEHQTLQRSKDTAKKAELIEVYAYLPTIFDIAVSAEVQHTPKDVREFNLDDFRTGRALYERRKDSRGGWW